MAEKKTLCAVRNLAISGFHHAVSDGFKRKTNKSTICSTPPKPNIVYVPLERMKNLWRPWKRAFNVKVLGRTIGFRVVQQLLTDMWAMNRKLIFTHLKKGYYLVRFECKEDYDYVLGHGPCMVDSKSLYLKMETMVPCGYGDHTTTMVWCGSVFDEFVDSEKLMELENCVDKAVKVD